MKKIDFYSLSVFETKNILNRLKYKGIGRAGRGRPRKTDYMTFNEAVNQHNYFLLKTILANGFRLRNKQKA